MVNLNGDEVYSWESFGELSTRSSICVQDSMEVLFFFIELIARILNNDTKDISKIKKTKIYRYQIFYIFRLLKTEICRTNDISNFV